MGDIEQLALIRTSRGPGVENGNQSSHIQNLHLIVKSSRFILSTQFCHYGVYQSHISSWFSGSRHDFKSAYWRHRRRHFRPPLRRHPYPKRGPSNNPRSKRSHWWESMSSLYPGAEPQESNRFFFNFYPQLGAPINSGGPCSGSVCTPA